VAEVELVDVTRVQRGMWRPVLERVDLRVRDGELLVLTGASGSGKSSLLRALAGADQLNSGRVLIDGRDVTKVAPDKRGVSMLAQGFALFPQLSVRDNIAFPLTMRKNSAKAVAARVAAVAERCGIADYLAARPDALNFDLRQRAMMARAVAGEPLVVCVDEPLAGSGVPMMMRARTPIATLQRDFGVTMLYATCSSTDALAIADRIAVIDHGVIQQVGTPAEVFDRPATVAVAGFVGQDPMNLIPAVYQDGFARVGGLRVKVGPAQAKALTSDRILIGLRPEDLYLGAPAAPHPLHDNDADDHNDQAPTPTNPTRLPTPGSTLTLAPDPDPDFESDTKTKPKTTAGLRAVAVLIKDSGREYIVHARMDGPDGPVDLIVRHPRGAPPIRGENLLITTTAPAPHLFDAGTARRLPD
jgi:multiple sugar transport system ATP-binding protein